MTTYTDNIDAEGLDQKTPPQTDNSDDLTANSGSASEDDSQELLG